MYIRYFAQGSMYAYTCICGMCDALLVVVQEHDILREWITYPL